MTDPTADAAKLLPCPFCGSAPVVYRHPAVASLWSIQCTSRDCDVRPSSPYLETVEATAAKWNTRPQPAPSITPEAITGWGGYWDAGLGLGLQPAPPEAAPDDWTGVQKRIAETMCDTVNMATGEATRQARISEADWTRIKTFIDRLGLAARPKVEDAEVN